MNLLVNPGFEAGDTGWTLATGATVTSAYGAHMGVNACRLRWKLGTIIPPVPSIRGAASQEIASTAGLVYELSAWVALESGQAGARLQVQNPAGAAWEDVDTILYTDLTDDWVRLSGSVTAAGDTLAVRVVVYEGAQSKGYILADDLIAGVPVEIQLMPRGLRKAYVDFYNKIASISTADGYYHTVSTIIPRMAWPNEQNAPRVFPYVCVPADHQLEAGDYPEVDSGSVRVRLRQPVIVVLKRSWSDDAETGAAADALNWHDDILRAVMPAAQSGAWNAGSVIIRDITPHKFRVLADPVEGGAPFVSVEFLIDLIVSRGDLGPEAS
ncbi:MAG TPA: hypothetical protein PLQ87_12315 [Phycisphaerae bacterium]|nr:hypothetical protein [Phycisphaerae bacterium]